MKITIIGPYAFGYLDFLIEKLEEYPHVSVTYINFDEFKLRYKSVWERILNFFSKNILGHNLKRDYRTKLVKENVLQLEKQDYIVLIRPDRLDKNAIPVLKSRTKNFVGFYFDAVDTLPKMQRYISYFDKVFTYERKDAEKYGMEFITNFIPKDDVGVKSSTEGVFNVSSYDERFETLERIGRALKTKNYPYSILIRSDREISSEYVEAIRHLLPLAKAEEKIKDAKILLDVQKSSQHGLTFRVFEALGHQKKLITTNQDIKNYDFYDPQNILILDPDNIEIPQSFLMSPYKNIPEDILSHYRREAWIERVFDLK